MCPSSMTTTTLSTTTTALTAEAALAALAAQAPRPAAAAAVVAGVGVVVAGATTARRPGSGSTCGRLGTPVWRCAASVLAAALVRRRWRWREVEALEGPPAPWLRPAATGRPSTGRHRPTRGRRGCLPCEAAPPSAAAAAPASAHRRRRRCHAAVVVEPTALAALAATASATASPAAAAAARRLCSVPPTPPTASAPTRRGRYWPSGRRGCVVVGGPGVGAGDAHRAPPLRSASGRASAWH